jgi:hypothetical protein
MAAALLGLVLFALGILVWVGTVTLLHAVAVALVVAGLLLVLWYAAPAHWYARRVP